MSSMHTNETHHIHVKLPGRHEIHITSRAMQYIFEMNRFDKFPQECDSAEAMILLKTGRQTQ